MQPAGIKTFEKRKEAKSGAYSYEQRHDAQLTENQERKFRANSQAWEFFQSKAGSYCKAAIWWVICAKGEETRQKRLATLIEYSAKGELIPPLIPRRPKHQ